MAVNTSIDYQRKQLRRGDCSLEEVRNIAASEDASDNPEVLQERNELKGVVGKLTGMLTARQRRVFVLRDLQGFSTGEVAGILRCSQITVRVHLAGARTRIRDALRQHYPEYITANPLRKGKNK